MDETRFPVTMAVTRPDGTVEHLRVGTAIRRGDGFALQLGELAIGAPAEPARRASPGASSGGAPAGMVFPPYGRSKGAPIVGATVQDLEFYASGSRRSLADPSKSRWHEKERQLLAAIEAEIARQGGASPPPQDDDEPPPRRDEDVPF
jgi:hypothetical protein